MPSWREAFAAWLVNLEQDFTTGEIIIAERAYEAGRDCGRTELTQTDSWTQALYIGPIEQFKGRTADVAVFTDFVRAQFHTGELWETHSRLNFPVEHWEAYEDFQCACHERDGSYTCAYCKRFGYYGHCETPESD